MKKVYQTIVDKDKGNCMQAVIASLFEKELEDVPNFIEYNGQEGTSGQLVLWDYMEKNGYQYGWFNRHPGGEHHVEIDTKKLIEMAKFDGGVNGYLYASVPSQTFEDSHHAVVTDLELNIVHDPNPNQKALRLTPDDVDGFMVVTRPLMLRDGTIVNMDKHLKENE